MKEGKKKQHPALRVLKVVLIVVAALLIFVDVAVAVYAKVDGGQFIGPLLKNVVYSYQLPLSNSATRQMKETLGGTALGVCHPEDDAYNISLLGEANIGWVRFDISDLPYEVNPDGTAKLDANGNVIETHNYKEFKARCKLYVDQGIRVMAVTPYIDDMLTDLDRACAAAGQSTNYVDVFNNGGEYPAAFETMIRGISAYFAQDLTGGNPENYQYVAAFQISNELTVEKWMGALSKDQIIYYIGELQMKQMHETCQSRGVPIGYNTHGGDLVDLPQRMVAYEDYHDFVGLDLYLGCFEDAYKTNFIYELLVRHLYNVSKKPVFIQEFGYISSGSPKSEEEQVNYLQQVFPNHPTIEAIQADPMGFVDEWDVLTGEESPLTREARRKYNAALAGGKTEDEAKAEAAEYILQGDQIAHLYKALPEGYELTDYKHTEQGQAEFFTDTVKMLSKLDCVCGIFVYCYSDSTECYQCAQPGCPVETGWGLVSIDESAAEMNEASVYKKASFYAIQEAFGEIAEKNARKYG